MHSKANESFEPPSKSFSTWLQRTQEWKSKYANADVDKERKYELESTEPDVMNVYSFLETLGEKIPANSTVVPDQGGNLCWTMQTLKVRDNWRLYTNLGNSSMGFAFPCCIGSALGTSNPVICIDGDGGFQMNIQELKTAVDYNLPIKTFILNNSGYGIIKQFQDAYFDKRYIVTNFNPVDFVSIAKSYGMHALRIGAESDIDAVLDSVFEHSGPVLVDVAIQQCQKIFPKLEFGNALEHMTPFIPIDELQATMIAEMAPRQEPKGWVQAKH
jgi:acetolactate synthase-1/2/3 large subunit